jgi:3-dehydroquinate synthase
VEWLLEQKVERRDIVVAFGGGVIGDLVGLCRGGAAAGGALRADPHDAAGAGRQFGGRQDRHQHGAGQEPCGGVPPAQSLVLADIGVLESLPARDFLAGYGEVVKYGLLGDAAFFDWLEVNGPQLYADAGKRQRAVRRSVEMKAGIVERDETEEGERALLNLGHTFCHALEKATGYSDRLLAWRGGGDRLRAGF